VKTRTWNVLLLAAALWMLGARFAVDAAPPSANTPRPAQEAFPTHHTDPTVGVRDASGRVFAVGGYRRIVSASTVADHLLLALAEPSTIVAFTRYTREHDLERHRFTGGLALERLDDLETLLAARPDLVVLHGYGDPSRIERLRDAGVPVFDLGPMTGVDALLEDARVLGALLGAPSRGERFARSFERRIRAVARDVEHPRTALYVAVVGDRLFGGTRGSSYHDVLRFAGLRDVAAARFEGWPEYTLEDVLALDPEVLVTKSDMQDTLCARPGLRQARACRSGDVVALDGALLDSPGPAMLDAAEALFDAAYRGRCECGVQPALNAWRARLAFGH